MPTDRANFISKITITLPASPKIVRACGTCPDQAGAFPIGRQRFAESQGDLAYLGKCGALRRIGDNELRMREGRYGDGKTSSDHKGSKATGNVHGLAAMAISP